MFSIRLAAAAAVLATVVTSVSASSSINETALCRLPESEDLATLLEGAAGVSPVNSIIFTHWKHFSKVFLLSQLEFAPPQSTLFCSPCAVAQFYAAKNARLLALLTIFFSLSFKPVGRFDHDQPRLSGEGDTDELRRQRARHVGGRFGQGCSTEGRGGEQAAVTV